MKNQNLIVQQLEQKCRENAMAIITNLEQIKQVSQEPFAADMVLKGVIDYLAERGNDIGIKKLYTLQELESMGMLYQH